MTAKITRRALLAAGGVSVAAAAVGTVYTFGPRMNQSAASDADVRDYLQRLWLQPSEAEIAALEKCVTHLKQAGLWNKLDAFWDLRASTRQGALLNIRQRAFDLKVQGHMVQRPGFGLAGDGVGGFARTGIMPGAEGVRFSLSSASFGAFCSINDNGGNNYAFGSLNGNFRLKTRQAPADAPSGYLNDAAQPLTGEPLSGIMPGLYTISRTSRDQLSLYKNDVQVGQSADPSTAVKNEEILLNRAGARFGSETFALAFVGAGLDANDMRELTLCFRDYLAAGMRPIACFGDSLTQGIRNMGKDPTATVTNYPSRVQALSGRIVYNGGMSGQTSTQIGKRAETDNIMNGAVNVIWAGRNNYREQDTVLSDIAKIVNHIGHDRYLVLSVLNGDYETEAKGLVDYQRIVSLNTALQQLYGDRFLDIRDILLKAGDTGSADDRADLERDIVPRSLRSDTIHLNDDGDALVGQSVANAIAAKGW
ncbi:SGNH/GDSL hydrolase family protein [Rhizobium sp. SG2393]|uniref:SGNH/GDSL hydrolase family protein n=1 Tax=Rhizobium sp. SG2393 TaxID=3276279 RepID=UPI00366CDB9F